MSLPGGELEQIMIKGKLGYILLSQAGKDAVLVLMAKESGKLGLICWTQNVRQDILQKVYKGCIFKG